MDRYEFLRAVLPPPGSGNYVAFFAKSATAKWNRHCNTIEELADNCVEASNQGLTAYFALGTYKDNTEVQPDGRIKTQRTAIKADRFKTLAIDIDVAKEDETKCYPTTEVAMQELIRFIKASGMPVPLVVSSGHGLHAYWPLIESIPKAEWREHGVALKSLCHKHNLIIDEGKVHDPSMVLRPLDTLNGDSLVRVLVPGAGAHPVSELAKKFGDAAPKSAKPAHLTGPMLLNESILMSNEEWPPIVPAKAVQNCKQMAIATEANGKNTGHDMWMLVLGVARFAENPEMTAFEWSKGHPEFSTEATLAKMSTLTAPAPTSCSKFDLCNPGVCTKCPHWGKIGSPARTAAPDPAPMPAAPVVPTRLEDDEEDAPTVDFKVDPLFAAPAFEPPPPFRRTVKGIQWENHGIWLDICNYDMFPSHIVRDPTLGYSMVEWVWKKPHVGYVRMLLRTSAIFNDSSIVDLNSALADNGFLVENKFKQAQLGAFMRAYTQLLQKHQASVDLYDSFGWKDNNTRFVLGSTEFRREDSGSVSTHEVGVSKLITTKRFEETFTAKGDLNLWSTWTKILDHPSLAIHQVELARAFAAPLMAFTGLRGVVFSLVGESGRGKTTMQRWAASVYGIPEKVNTTANDTQMSMVQRMGVWNCLPLAIDEVTLAKPDLIANLIYWGTQGQDRNRVTETQQANTWALPLSLSTNRSVRDKVSTIGADVDAIQMRLLEFEFNESPVFADSSDIGRRMYMMVGENYGLAGRTYLPYLLSLGEAKVKADIEEHIKEVSKTYKFEFEGKERYWQMAVVLCDLGAKYAKSIGLIQYDYRKGTRAMIEQIKQQRVLLSGAKLDTYDLIAEYLTAFNGMALTMVYRDGKATVRDPLPRGEVRIRKELYVTGKNFKPDRGFMYLDKTHFHHWLVGKGFDFKTVLDTVFAEQAGFKPGTNGRIYMGKDSGITLPACTALGLNLSHEKLKGMLNQYELPVGNVTNINTARGDKQ